MKVPLLATFVQESHFPCGPRNSTAVCECGVCIFHIMLLLLLFYFSQINAVAADTCQTPLHVAIKAQKLAAVQMLVQLEANVEAVDANHDTMYHCAAITTKDIIKVYFDHLIIMLILITIKQMHD